MPQLDFTFFITQFFWAIFFFILTYFTISKGFCYKYVQILTTRKEKINYYIEQSKKFLEETKALESKITNNHQKIGLLIETEKNKINQRIELLKKKSLDKVQLKLRQKEEAHKKNLIILKSSLISELEKNSQTIKIRLKNYFYS